MQKDQNVRFRVAITCRSEYVVDVPRDLVICSGIGALIYDKIIERLQDDESPGIGSVEVEQVSEAAVVQLLSSSEPGIGVYPEDRNNHLDAALIQNHTPNRTAPVIYSVT